VLTVVTESRYVDAVEFARMAERSVHTIRYWQQTGHAPPSAKIGRRRVWKRADVYAWLDEQFATADGTPAA
jgi:DNA-binding transcriptional MerR regulator